MATKTRSPPALIHPPAGLGRCLQGRIAVKSQGVTQQRDISRRSISSTMNQSHKQPTKQPPPPKSFPCQGWGSPWAGSPQCEQEMGRLWGARGASSPQLFGGTWGGGTGKSPPRMRCLSETLQPEGFFFFCRRKCRRGWQSHLANDPSVIAVLFLFNGWRIKKKQKHPSFIKVAAKPSDN